MVTGEIKNKLDRLWNSMWSNQMTNPWIDIQQITYLIFIKMLDDAQIKQEVKINDQLAHGISSASSQLASLLFKPGNYVDKEDGNNIDVPYKNLRWSVFKEFSAKEMFENMRINVFPFIKKLDGKGTTAFAHFMKDAQFTVSNAYILDEMVKGLSDPGLGLDNHDLMGDCYEYLLSKMATSGDNGQFRTPRHIIDMMVEIAKPTLKDKIIDPAMGTAGFLAESSKYIQSHYESDLMNVRSNAHYHNEMFTGYDTDTDMLRIGTMNMVLHGVENAKIKYNNSLSEDYVDHDAYSLVLANPPFSGSLNPNTVAKSLNQISGGTKSTELLFLSLFIRLLKVGGRCVSIVPVGVVNNTNEKAYTRLRKMLVDDQKLQAVIYMPSGIFQPYAGVQTAILVFTKTNSGGTDRVWLYDMEADGYSLDQKRNDVKENDIPDIENRFANPQGEADRTSYDKSFFVSKEEIVENNYVLSWNKYHKRHIEKKVYRSSSEIIESIEKSEQEFSELIKQIKTEIK